MKLHENGAYLIQGKNVVIDSSEALKDIVSDGKVDLTERFVRGEKSRTTEGSGLGLSIAKNLTTLMGGKFEINVDGDLFIATIEYEMI